MKIRTEIGRRMIFWGSLALFCWAGCELYIRMDAIIPWIKSYMNLVANTGASLSVALASLEKDVMTVPLYLVLCMLLALPAFFLRGRARAALVFIPLSLAFIFWETRFTGLIGTNLLTALKVIPQLLIACGYLIQLIVCALAKNARKKRRAAQSGAWNTRHAAQPSQRPERKTLFNHPSQPGSGIR